MFSVLTKPFLMRIKIIADWDWFSNHGDYLAVLSSLVGQREDPDRSNCWVHTVTCFVAALFQRTHPYITFSLQVVNLILCNLYCCLNFSWNCWRREDSQVDRVSNVISLGSLYQWENRLQCVVNLKVRVVAVVANLEMCSLKSVSLKQEALTQGL